MYNIIIVEDTLSDCDKLEKYVRLFFERVDKECAIRVFQDGLEMLNAFKCHEDIIFLDIDLPNINGMDLAKRIREKDEDVTIIFVSNLSRFALKGYQVNALDYIVKPFNYDNIEHRLERALNINKRSKSKSIILKINASTNIVCDIDTIKYIEKDGNYLIFHTEKDEYRVRGTFNDFINHLANNLFSFCMKGILINLEFVEKTVQESVYLVGGTVLPIARQRKKEFINDLFNYFGEEKGWM